MKAREERVFQAVSHVIMILASAACVIPFLLLIISSFTDNNTIVANGYSFFPEKWGLDAYRYLFQRSGQILQAYGITVLVTVVGTAGNLLFTTMLAYPLSRADLPGRKALSFMVFFTMLFNGGLVPTYLLYTTYLGVKNTLAGLIVPLLLLNAYWVMIMRTFFQNSIPKAIIESAQIDGASEMRIFYKIILPMGKPIIATVCLFAGITYWNDWYNGMVYVTEADLFSIQQLLNRMLSDIQFLQTNASMTGAADYISKIPGTTLRMAIAVVGILPILVIYPFMQNNFVKGIAIGAVKG
ncbi:carbohydrate ABC transporter permease [Acutalibacter caecimuris]|uniref:carbohydrate ABC transporter permease n=1 Tax=Acutalibacter caecimuris TaxID=3093657 RepID=UPI002AC9D9F4|nr:carbohydrate ABC transporter permease [Acutalibacter sp. M00118]